ncbi:ABC transporter ATP-binding protein [Geobacter sp. AOG2]|uniref:ABC transporter ATP-binding protein n=1 Tax=Geobacter sp. AOG2 TaxID=1566347 RepID=UPI001CC66093|nr:ABC transporter ATP-binding protein [Geobacter sp. AOG2]GFE60684.1 iron(III) ABC transporter ATP-binding protein [Geobacter sp. AOG2]
MALIEVRDIAFSYRRLEVLNSVDLDIREGAVTALLGPNGSGKTTLLKLLIGLLKPTRGNVHLNGADIRTLGHREVARQMAYVPQMHKEAFAYRVVDVVLMGRMPHKGFFSPYSATDRQIASEALEKLGIVRLAEQPYTEISGGERQLTLIARAMTQGARVFVMDEPTNGLDYGNQIRLLERLKGLAADGYTFVFSTHHPDHAMAVADRVVMMRGGSITHDGTVIETINSKNLLELYSVDVRLCPIEPGVSVCIPALRWEHAARHPAQNTL